MPQYVLRRRKSIESKRLRPLPYSRILGRVTTERVVVVGDSHFGSGNPDDEAAFHDFLAAVPRMGTRLLLMGDLFEFWFEYRRVIPRRPFRTLARIAAVADAGVKVELFGGNHDRWSGWPGNFWEDLGMPFHAGGTDLQLAGRKAWVHHGDGLAEWKLGGKILHKVTRSPVTIAIFRAIHPDLSFWLIDRLSFLISEKVKSAEALDAAAEFQERFARGVLDQRPEISLVVLAHTHRQRLVEHAPGRFYLNAGAWIGARQYAVVSPGAIWTGAWPARP